MTYQPDDSKAWCYLNNQSFSVWVIFGLIQQGWYPFSDRVTGVIQWLHTKYPASPVSTITAVTLGGFKK